MEYVFGAIVFLFGAVLGSFISVIANRYNTGLSFLKGRSVCFSCNAMLKKRDLVPLFSFLFLKGKCRYCGNKIPKETLITEILMGTLTVLAFFKSDFSISNLSAFSSFHFLILTAIFGVILLISIHDIKHFIIPDSFLIFLFILSFIYLSAFSSFHFSLLILNILSGFILAIPFLLIFLVSKGTWFGFGDVKYILILGFFLGFSQGLSAIILSFWIGAAFSVAALSFKRIAPHINLPLLKNSLTMKSEIPFGPFLSVGIIISFYFNADLFQIHSFFNAF